VPFPLTKARCFQFDCQVRVYFGCSGQDQAGALVLPGLYLCRFGLEVDDQSRSGGILTRAVAVAY